MKEHRGEVHSIMCNKDGTQAISSSSDASCIIWDVKQGVRIMALFESTIFRDAIMHPDESQYLTCGTHKKITYWDAYDASAIREIEGGNAEMTCLEIASNGNFFISGSADRLLRLWHYDDGITVGVGKGHSGTVNRVAFSPDLRTIVSVGSEGGIFIWNVPAGLIQN
jgi:WD40 repeat protein